MSRGLKKRIWRDAHLWIATHTPKTVRREVCSIMFEQTIAGRVSVARRRFGEKLLEALRRAEA